MFVAWRLSQGPDGDRRAFGLVIIAALTATPIVWEHYMVLLFVPIALVSPRFSRAWLIPVCAPLIESPSPHPRQSTQCAIRSGHPANAGPWLLLELLTGIVVCTTPEQRRAAWARVRHVRTPAVRTERTAAVEAA